MSLSEKNTPDFSSYVALGDSVTSGYADGALFYKGQQNAYSQIIARQFQLTSGGNFKQAFVSPGSVGIGFMGNSRMVLQNAKDCSGENVLIPKYIAAQGDLAAFATNTYPAQGPFNNMAVPGAKSVSLITPGYGNPNNGPGNFNPFFTRMASNPLTASVLSDALAMSPGFFSLFIGNNDVLAFALSGATLDAVTPVSGPPGIGFTSSLLTLVNALTANGTQGAIANIPDLRSIPYFTVVPYNGLLLDKAGAALLNARYKNTGMMFREGNNSFVIEDITIPEGIRQACNEDLILADVLLDAGKCNYMKAMKPIPEQYTLIAAEIEIIQNAVDAYNNCILSIAQQKGLAFVDVNSFIKTLSEDSSYNETSCTITYKKRGVFSLDGVHLSPFGQALLANVFIKAINTRYETLVPHVNILRYSGIIS